MEIMEEKHQWLPCEGELAREARLRGCKLAVSEVLIPSGMLRIPPPLVHQGEADHRPLREGVDIQMGIGHLDVSLGEGVADPL